MLKVKKVVWFIEDSCWSIKCRYAFQIHGAYGLARVVEKIPFRFLKKYLRKYGATIGKSAVIEPGIVIHRPGSLSPFTNLIMGDSVYIGHKIIFDLSDKIVIKDNVKLGAGCQLWTHVGFFSDTEDDKNPEYKEIINQILIKENAICYSGVIISPGVVVGKQSRVGANSVVTKEISANSFSAGNPAVVKRIIPHSSIK